MAIYDFDCDSCHARFTLTGPMSDPPSMSVCTKCGGEVYQDFSGVQFDVFPGYEDIHTTGTPIWLSSKKKRDAFHAANGVTLDSNRYGGKRKRKYAADQVSVDDVMTHYKKHGPPKKTDLVDFDPNAGTKLNY